METKAEESAPKPAAAPEKVAQDPLRVVFYGLSDAEEKNLRGQFLERILGPVAEMHVRQLQRVAQFVDVVETANGCDTPAETFIADLVGEHFDVGLTPELAVHKIEAEDGFRVNFRDVLTIAERLKMMYPQGFPQEEK